jgi:hypothetical protein
MCPVAHVHLSYHQRVPSIDVVALYYERARDTHYDSNAYYCLCLLIVSSFLKGGAYWITDTTNKLYTVPKMICSYRKWCATYVLFGSYPLFSNPKFGSGHTMGKVLRLVPRQCLERNSGKCLVWYHKWLPKTHNNYLDCGQKFNKEMKYTAITESSWTDTWLYTSEYNQSVFFSICNGSSRDNILHTSSFDAFRT